MLICSPHLAAEFVYADEWGQAQFALYAWNYQALPWSVTHGLPTFGLAGDRPIYYANHPWLASLLLGLWGLLFGVSELTFRTCALSLALVRLAAVWATGRLLGGARVGLLAATFYALAPLSVRLGRVYGMEAVYLTFALWAFYFGVRWIRKPNRRDWLLTASCLGLAQASDVYGCFLLPWLLAVAAWRPRWRRAWLGWAAVIVGVQAAQMLYLGSLGLLAEAWSRGAGRQEWSDALLPRYYYDRALEILRLNAWVAPLLGLAALPRHWRVLSPWLLLCLLQLLLVSHWLRAHLYHLLFWSPLVAWLGALTLGRRGLLAQVLAVLAAAALAVGPVQAYFVPQFAGDLEAARVLRAAVREDDLLLGVSPHVAYYMRHRSMVPYFYFWQAGADAEARRALVRDLVVSTGHRYRRVILLTQFTDEQLGRGPATDFSTTLENVEGWRRQTPAPGPNLEVWKR